MVRGRHDHLLLYLYRFQLREYVTVWVKLCVLDAVLWLLTVTSKEYVEPVSRRYANLTYILWTVSGISKDYNIIST